MILQKSDYSATGSAHLERHPPPVRQIYADIPVRQSTQAYCEISPCETSHINLTFIVVVVVIVINDWLALNLDNQSFYNIIVIIIIIVHMSNMAYK